MDELKPIGFNIWDDYIDEDVGQCSTRKDPIQETTGYVEEFDVLTKYQKGEISDIIFTYLQILDLPGVEMENCGEGTIFFRYLSHKRRERLVEELKVSGLQYNGIPIDFYSES